MMSNIRIKGCKTKDINDIINKINNMIDNSIVVNYSLNILIENEACLKAGELIDTYDIRYCNTIIYAHSKSSIYEAIKQNNGNIDIRSEVIFYRKLAYPYLCNLIINKITSQYQFNELIQSILIEKKECSICLDCIDNKNEIYLTNCKHCFHKSCFNKFIKFRRNRNCPNCREYLF